MAVRGRRAPISSLHLPHDIIVYIVQSRSLLRLFDCLLSHGLSDLDSAAVLAWLVVELTTGLNKLLECIVASRNVLEELFVDICELGGLLLSNFILVDLLLDWLRQLLCLLLCCVEVLLALCFTLENGAHDLLLLGVESVIVQGPAHAHHGDSTIAVTDCRHRPVDLDGGQHGVGHFLGVGNLVLSVEEVPNIKEAIHSREEEQAWSGGGPATVSKVS